MLNCSFKVDKKKRRVRFLKISLLLMHLLQLFWLGDPKLAKRHNVCVRGRTPQLGGVQEGSDAQITSACFFPFYFDFWRNGGSTLSDDNITELTEL